MKCPVCKDVTLQISTRQNIEIDYCPECRGIWLDRGELDKIIERSEAEIMQNAQQPEGVLSQPINQQPQQFQGQYQNQNQYQNQYQQPNQYHQQQDYYNKHSKQHKVRSFLSDLFD